MNRNKKIILAVLVIIIVITLIILAWFLWGRSGGQILQNTNNTNSAVSNQLPLTNSKNSGQALQSTPEAQKQTASQAEVKRLAAAFAERFGSYSNETNFENLRDSKNMMTEKMAAWTDLYIRELTSQQPAASYYGITTKALSVNLSGFSENSNRVKAEVACQRIESKETTTNQAVTYQTLVLDLQKSGSVWLIDGATWQK